MPQFTGEEEFRKLLGKEFSKDYPYSPLVLATMKLARDSYDTYFEPVEEGKGSEFKYIERANKRYSSSETHKMRKQFAKNAYQLSLDFESDLIEVVSFSWRFQAQRTV